MQRCLALVSFAVAVLLISCGKFLTGDCAGVGLPAVAVTILDASTGLHAAAGATLILQSTACSDSAVGTADDQVLSGCVDYEGVYTVTVRKAGYRDWIQTGVRVRETCSVETQRLTVRLEHSS